MAPSNEYVNVQALLWSYLPQEYTEKSKDARNALHDEKHENGSKIAHISFIQPAFFEVGKRCQSKRI